MAEVRTDFYGSVGQQNPLEQFGKTVGVMNALEQNKLLKGQQVQQQTAIDTGKLELARNQLGTLRQWFAPHLNNPNVKSEDITKIGTDAIKQGIATPQQVATELASFPRNGSAQEKQAWVRNIYVRSLDHDKQIAMQLGQVQPNAGPGGTTYIQQPMRPDMPSAQRGAVPNTLAPGTEVYNPQTRQQELITTGEPGQYQPGGAGAKPQPKPGQGGTVQGAVPGAASASPAAPKNNARLPAAAPMGEASAAEAAAGQSGTLLASDRANAADFGRQVYPLEQAIPKLEALGKTGTGPGSEEFNQFKSFLQTAGLPGLDTDKIKNFDQAKKYLTDWVMANGSAGTNDKLAASFASNASVNISNAAAVEVAKAALALRRMKQAQVAAFESSGLPERDYARWSAEWNRKQDPRVFGFDLMTAPQRAKVIGSIPPGKREEFMFAVQEAQKYGLLRAPTSK